MNSPLSWFDAWKYDKEETLWRAFLLFRILMALKETAASQGQPVEAFEKLESLLYREMELEKVGGVKIDLAKLGGVTAKVLLYLFVLYSWFAPLTKLVEGLQSGVAKDVDEAAAAIQRERTKVFIEQIQLLEKFQDTFRGIGEGTFGPNRLVVFVDDLDRCLPEKAIQVLEAIKLFLDVRDCVFILGIDQDVISRGIEMKYKDVRDRQDADGKPHFTIEGIKLSRKDHPTSLPDPACDPG